MLPPVLFQRMGADGNREAFPFLLRAHRWIVAVAAAMAAVVTVLATPLIRLFGGAKYLSAASTVGWIAWAFAAFASYTVMSNYFALRRDTRALAGLVLASVLVNLVLNVLLIPRLGIQGSGIALFISYAALAAVTYFPARHAIVAGSTSVPSHG